MGSHPDPYRRNVTFCPTHDCTSVLPSRASRIQYFTRPFGTKTVGNSYSCTIQTLYTQHCCTVGTHAFPIPLPFTGRGDSGHRGAGELPCVFDVRALPLERTAELAPGQTPSPATITKATPRTGSHRTAPRTGKLVNVKLKVKLDCKHLAKSNCNASREVQVGAAGPVK
jgi:hypothetical protein